jgi:hypothetical protein
LARQIGAENRAKAEDAFDEAHMIAAYSDLYSQAMQRPQPLVGE